MMGFKQFRSFALLTLAAGVFTWSGCDSVVPSASSPAGSGGSGVTQVPANLRFANGYSYGFGSVAVGATATARLVVSYTGNQAAGAVTLADGLSSPFGFVGGSYPGTGGTCGKSISSNCIIVVSYTPTDDTGTLTTLAISEVDTYSIGTYAIGTSTDKTFTITHGGSVSATSVSATALSAPFSFKGGTFPGTGGTCTVGIGANCTIVVSFAPTAVAVSPAALTLSYSNGVQTETVTRTMTATGANPALLAISDGATYNFGNVTLNATTATKTFTVTNSGGMAATSGALSGLTTPFTNTGGTCSGTIAVGTCTIIVQFSPAATGTFNTTMSAAYFDGKANQTVTRPMTGVGVGAAVLTLSDGPGTYDYGTQAVGSATNKTFTVNYSGGAPATLVSETTLAAPYTFKGGTFPGTGGTCATSIAANCTVVVTYSPTGTGNTTGTATISYYDGAATQTTNRPLTGTGAPPAVLAFTPVATYNYGATVSVGSSTNNTFNVNYSGGVPATGLAATGLSGPYSFAGGTYPGTGGTCATTISSNCTVVVTYAPTATGTISNTLALGFNNGVAPGQSITQVSDGATYDYGIHATSSATDKTLTVSYSGGVAATGVSASGLAAPFAFKGGSYPGTGGSCGTSISVNCTLVVTFSPTATTVSNGNLILTYNDGLSGGQTASRSLAGTGAAPATLTISQVDTYDIGTHSVNSSTDTTFTVTYGGGVPATGVSETTLAAPFAFKGGAYPGTGGTCSATISSNCTIVVTYTPTAIGLLGDTITLGFNNGASAQTSTRIISGTGAAAAVLTISDGVTYNYGTLATTTSTDKTFTVTWSGGVGATAITGTGLSAPLTFKGGVYPGTGGTCAASLSSGTCTVVVNYNPTAVGSTSQTLSLGYNDGTSAQTATRGITGTAALPAVLAISDGATFNYGTQATTSATDKTFTVTYTGGMNATTVSETTLAAPMAFKGGSFPGTGGTCASTISATCTIVVTYSPTSAVVSNKTITLGYNDGAAAQTATRAVTGTGAAAATLAISDGATFDYGTNAIGSSTDKTFTVTYGGGVPASSVATTGLSAPYSFKGGTFPGTGGTCATTISATCTLVVTYAPTAAGVISNTLTLTFNDGVTPTQTATRAMTGTAASVAVLSISDGATYNYGTFATTSANDHTFTVSYSGGISATTVASSGLAAPYTFKGGSYPGTGGTCGTTIAANCTVVVTYTPTAAVVSSGNMILTYNDGLTAAQTSSRSLSGTGAAPATLAISLSDTYDFGTHAVSSATDTTFTVTYGGGVLATAVSETTLAAPFAFKGGTFPGTGGTCSATISATCSIVVTYTPTTSVTSGKTITLSFNDGTGTQTSTRIISGTGAAAAVLTLSDGVTYNFGTLATGTSTDKTFTVTWSGGVGASSMSASGLSAPFTFKGGAYPGTGGTCAATLASGTCTIVVNYSPTAVGALTQTLSVAYNDGTTTQHATRDMTATGAAPAVLAISDGATFNYGTQATTSATDKTFTVTYTGGVSATTVSETTLATPMAFKGGTFPGTGGTCAATISATCTIVVTYSPTAAVTSNKTITLGYNDGAAAQTATRAITGTGAAAATLSISDGATYDYGTLAVGSSTDKTFTVTYGGGVNATSVVATGLSAPYSFKGGTFPGTGGTCTSTISATCTVVVTYAPTAAGLISNTLTLTFNDGLTPTQTATRAITGTAAAVAVLTISDATTYNYGTFATTTANDHTFTVSYAGGISASVVTASGLAAPFTFKGGSYPGTGGTCGLTISANCTLVVTYTPSAAVVSNGNLILTYNDGLTAAQTSSRSLTGTGTAPATLAISLSDTYDFGTHSLSSATDTTFTVTYGGGVNATSVSETTLAAPFAFKGGSFPGTGGTCTGTISATCTIVVTYTPTAAVTSGKTITLSYNDGTGVQTSTRIISGTGAAAAVLTISDGVTYNYGTLATGTSTDKTFTVTLTGGVGSSAMSGSGLSAPFTFKGGSYPGTGGTCAATLASGTCTVVVTYNPTAVGSSSQTLSLSYNDGTTTQSATRGITGVAAAPAVLAISDGATFDYGTQATSSATDKTFTVTYTGGMNATTVSETTLAAPMAFKGGSYPGTGGTCAATISANCTIVVTYSPTAAVVSNKTITLGYNDGAAAQTATRAVTGTGAAAATLAISDGATYDYGNLAIGSSTDKTLTVTYGGGVNATSVVATGLSAPYSFKGGTFPGTGGTCAATISATCTVVVTYAPTAAGTISNTLLLTFNDGVTPTQTSSRAITGTANSVAVLTISDATTYNYGTFATTSANDHTFAVSYSGGTSATAIVASGLAAPYTFKGGTYPGTGGTCGTTIAANCTLVVTYTPTAVTVSNGNLVLTYNDGLTFSQTTSRSLTGTGAAPATLVISQVDTYDFGTHSLNSATDTTFTVTYGGGVNATAVSETTLAAPFAFKGGSFPGTGGTCAATISASCSIVVTYTPTSAITSGKTITLSFNDGTGTQTSKRIISGTGAAAAVLTISDGVTYNYGTMATGTSTDKTFTVTYSGGVSATSMNGAGLTTPFSFKDGTYPGTGGTCAATLASGTCTIVVNYSPATTGAQTGTINLAYNDGTTTQHATRDLSATGAAPAVLAISDGATFSYGTQATTSATDKTFTVTYTGGVNATSVSETTLASPMAFKGGSYPGTGGTCAATISANCTIVVTYTPTAAVTSNKTITLSFNNGAASGQTATRAITGTGATAAVLTISDGVTYNYGTLATGTSTDKTFTVTWSGGVTATGMSASGLTAPFTFKGGSYPGTGGTCAATLASGTCTIVVNYSPTATGSLTQTLNLAYNDGTSAQTATRAMTGTGATPATLVISDAATYDYGTQATTSTTDKTFTVTYAGGVSATTVSETTLAAPMAFKGGSFPGTGGTCSATISATCTIVVTYSPTAAVTSNKTITLSYNDGAAAQTATRAVTGTGAAAATLTISDAATYDYTTHSTGSATDHTFTVTYGGGVSATSVSGSGLTAPYAFKGGSFPGTGGTCTGTITADCTFVVTYSPTAAGTANQTVTLTFNNGIAGGQTSTRAMTGVGASPATLVISDAATYDYGTKATTSANDKTFTVSYSGGVSATAVTPSAFTGVFTYKGGTFPGTGGTCLASPATISANCTIVVTFTPTAATTYSDSILLTYNDGTTSQSASRAMTGTGGTAASLAISDGATYNYGTITKTSSADKTFTVTNSGQATATGINETTLAAPYAFKDGTFPGTGGTCGTSLAGSSATCTVVVTFTPTASSSYNNTLTLNYSTGLTTTNATRAITGVGATVTQVAAGGSHSCILLDSGSIKCWGLNSSGQLGDGTTVSKILPTLVSGISTATQITAGDDHTCARLSNGTIKCWGSDSAGQLGDDVTLANKTTPVLVAGSSGVLTVSAGAAHTCAVISDNTVYCWGSNNHGQLGDATTTDRPTPVAVSGMSTATQLSTGANHTCARLTNSTVQCWGDNNSGQIGNSSNTDVNTPTTAGSISTATAVTAGGAHSCALLSDNSMMCWGSDQFGQVGNDGSYSDQSAPAVVASISSATAISSGDSHTCALLSNNHLACWGANVSGQIGNGNHTNEPTEVPVSSMTTATTIASGGSHSCALLSSGAVSCWGEDGSGELGDGQTGTNSDVPVSAVGL